MTELREVTAAQAIAEVATGTVLLDVRELDEWMSGHAPTGLFVPMSSLPVGFESVPTDTRLLVICHAGSRSARVTRALVEAGFDAVNVAGGMLSWVDAGGPVVTVASNTDTASPL